MRHRSVACSSTESLVGGRTHMRQREPRCSKWICQWPSGRPRASSSRPWSFFFAPSAVPNRLAQLRDQACVTENPTAETYAGIAVPPSLSRTPARSMPPASCPRRFPLKPSVAASAEASVDSSKRCFSFSSLDRPDCSPSRSAAGLCLRTCESNASYHGPDSRTS